MPSFNFPQDNDKYSWTKHSVEKMKFYGLSPQRVLRILNHPERLEQAVAPGCLAGMQTVGNKNKTEIWVMWRSLVSQKQPIKGMVLQKKKIITTWRYPGVSPKKQVPIPAEILQELGGLEKE